VFRLRTLGPESQAQLQPSSRVRCCSQAVASVGFADRTEITGAASAQCTGWVSPVVDSIAAQRNADTAPKATASLSGLLALPSRGVLLAPRNKGVDIV
jgi:hypothetical protein